MYVLSQTMFYYTSRSF